MDKIKENIPFILLLIVMALFILAFFVSETSLFKTEEISTYTLMKQSVCKSIIILMT